MSISRIKWHSASCSSCLHIHIVIKHLSDEDLLPARHKYMFSSKLSVCESMFATDFFVCKQWGRDAVAQFTSWPHMITEHSNNGCQIMLQVPSIFKYSSQALTTADLTDSAHRGKYSLKSAVLVTIWTRVTLYQKSTQIEINTDLSGSDCKMRSSLGVEQLRNKQSFTDVMGWLLPHVTTD